MPEFTTGRLGTDEVLFAVDRSLGRVLLNRPRAINALTPAMVDAIQVQLQEWACDERVAAVSVEGAGERGLCAGGDVRSLRESIVSGEGDPITFWASEYRLNAAINSYPKPYVAVMDGVVMGGGVGISAYGSLRLVTEGSRIAMPETGIGFFPDVGSLHLLSRAPGELGTHLALTGLPIGGADAIGCGLADTLVHSGEVPDVLDRIAGGEPPGGPRAGGEPPDPSMDGPPRVEPPRAEWSLAEQREWIDECYAGDEPATILDSLAAHPDPRARVAAKVLSTRSPLSVAVTLEALRRAARMDTLEQVLEQDLALGAAFLHRSDFVEGVRAMLVDRDNDPKWSHARLADVDPDEVRAMFAVR